MFAIQFAALPTHVRKITDPNFPDEHTYYALVKVRDVPPNLPLKINPRKPNPNSPVSKKIRDGLLLAPKRFHNLNRGLAMLAQKAYYDNVKREFVVEFPYSESDEDETNGTEEEQNGDVDDMDSYLREAKYGLLDGGHTYRIIRDELDRMSPSQLEMLDDTYIMLEVKIGLTEKDDLILDEPPHIALARARNTSKQVQDFALANLAGKYSWIQESLDKEPYANFVKYTENEQKPIDVRLLIQLMTAFHPSYLKLGRSPVVAYSGMGACVKRFIEETKPSCDLAPHEKYQALGEILSDILRLFDTIRFDFPDTYSKVGGYEGLKKEDSLLDDNQPVRGREAGRPRATRGFTDYENSPYLLRFIGEKTDCLPDNGLVMPVFSAFRGFVEVDSKTGTAKWTSDPFQYWRLNRFKLVRMILREAKSRDRDPQQTGKQRNLWKALHKEIVTDQFLKQSGLLD